MSSPINCPECNVTMTPLSKKEMLKLTLENESKYRCPKCGKVFVLRNGVLEE